MPTTKSGSLIKERRLALGYTQEQIAEYCGVSKSAVCMWEKGDISNMRRNKIARLAEILRLSPVDIVNADDSEVTLTLTTETELLIMAYNLASEETKDIIFRVLNIERPKGGKP